jgi:riboflavin kinase/FMN adenylyltransferase
MRIFGSLEEARGAFGPAALTIGNFDGVHTGHTQILRRVCEVAKERGLKASALTFDPHPTKIVAPERMPRLMTTPEQRCRVMEQEGIAQVLILPFTRELSQISPEQFVRGILVEALDARAVFVGANFRFGHKHAGDTHLLQELGVKLGFEVEVIPPVTIRGVAVSSSEIRRRIELGDVSRAARLLGRPYALEGDVVRGHGVGAKQTVPTLNLSTPAEALPGRGVYISKTHALDQSGSDWPSVTNVGYRPTFGGDELSIETFLLAQLEGPAPGRIRVEFLRRLRAEKKFANPEELKAQILRDVGRAQSYFRRVPCHTEISSSTPINKGD